MVEDRLHRRRRPWGVPFLRDHGLDVRLFVEQLFANCISAFFGLDVILSAVALWVFVRIEGRRVGVRHV
jgi:hypothetical protein